MYGQPNKAYTNQTITFVLLCSSTLQTSFIHMARARYLKANTFIHCGIGVYEPLWKMYSTMIEDRMDVVDIPITIARNIPAKEISSCQVLEHWI